MIEHGKYRAQAGVSARARAGGFTLLEVMVSVAITAIGLLGIAKLQALAYASTGTASMRSLVAIQAAGLAASMHADRTYWSGQWSGGTAPVPITITGTGTGANFIISDNYLNTTASTTTYCQAGGAGAPCNPGQMASYDLRTWATALNGLLANLNPVTTISCPTINTPITCTIQVTWNERAVSVNNQGATNTQVASGTAAGGTFNPTYILYVEP
ncbi:MAG: prepilin-type N-terminal cleavage/methylation domain-containing protein [Steroidobacteraceae bacterium]